MVRTTTPTNGKTKMTRNGFQRKKARDNHNPPTTINTTTTTPKNKVGRPPKYNPNQVEQIKAALVKYTEAAEIPIMAEFCYQHGLTRHDLYNNSELNLLIKLLREKKEARLEKLALLGVIDKSMAIFSLKQLGWSDKQHLEMTGKDGGPIELERKHRIVQEVINNTDSRNKIAAEWRAGVLGTRQSK